MALHLARSCQSRHSPKALTFTDLGPDFDPDNVSDTDKPRRR
ncbi:MAG: hypothetical protein ACLF0G_02680 [Candidatus Brocadiia bacterium]